MCSIRNSKKYPKVLLLNPATTFRHRFDLPVLVPSGLQEIFFFLRQNNIDVKLIDCDLFNLEKINKQVLSQEYDIIGISVNSSHNYLYSIDLIRILRETYSDSVTIVVGGQHATALPEDFFVNGKDAEPDFVITGYGEQIMLNIIRGEDISKYSTPNKHILKEPNVLSTIPNIKYSFNDAKQEGNLVFCPETCRMLINLSRGCVNRCSFCMMSGCRQQYIYRNIDIAVKVIDNLNNIPEQVRCIVLSDPCFGYNRTWRHEVFKAMKQKSQIPFFVNMIVEAFEEDDYQLLAESNITVDIGIESFSPKMLHIMNKTKNPDSYIKAVEKILTRSSERNITLDLNILMNHPGETPYTQQETIDEVTRLRDNFPEDFIHWIFFEYGLYPGTDVFLRRKHYEEEYGAKFLFPKWWHKQKDQFSAARACIPSNKFGKTLSEMLVRKMDYKSRLQHLSNLNFDF